MATPQLSPGVLTREVDLTVGRADNILDNIWNNIWNNRINYMWNNIRDITYTKLYKSSDWLFPGL